MIRFARGVAMKRFSEGSEYRPKTSVLINGDIVHFMLMTREDEDALKSFFGRIPESEADLLRNDVRNPTVIASWVDHIDYSRVLPLVAWNESKEAIAGVATLHFSQGAYRHIADVRIVVGIDYRKLGLGSGMIKELIEIGNQLGLHYLKAEILSENTLAIKAFRQLGFESRVTLEGFYLTRKGEPRDIILMLKPLTINMEEDMFYLF